MNAFRTEGQEVPPILRVDERLVAQARDRLRELRSGRDAAAVEGARESLRRAASGSDELFPLILDAVEARATLGEISDDLRGVFGTHKPDP